jgi:glucuronate isomerase
MLKNDPNCSARGFIKASNVHYIGTTDDPIDSLEWHEKMAEDKTMPCIVRPSFRPDKAINITKAGFTDYLRKLAAAVGKDSLNSTQDVIDALVNRAEFFKAHGCVASDHGIDYMMFREGTMEESDAALKKILDGGQISVEEAEIFQTKIMQALGRAYHRLGIVMEIHYGAIRNGNEAMFEKEGADTGFDAIAPTNSQEALIRFMSSLYKEGALPKTVLFSLSGRDNELIDTALGLFQSDEVPGKIQHGPAWWFCDTKSGMEEQMKSLANLSVVGNFIGMLTDSRSFLSYPRHEYFRRIMCNVIGNWVENGEYPNDEEALKEMVEGISFKNAARYFGV